MWKEWWGKRGAEVCIAHQCRSAEGEVSKVWTGVSKEREVNPSRGRAIGEEGEAEEAVAKQKEEWSEVEERHASH